MAEIFSLTGAEDNCSSYQQPRRGRGRQSNETGISARLNWLYVLEFEQYVRSFFNLGRRLIGANV